MNKNSKDKKGFDVIGIGNCTVDLLGIVPSFPRPDTKNKMIRFIQQGGGPVATALVTLSRLGAKVSFIGKLGDNEFSHFVINKFIQEGVKTVLDAETPEKKELFPLIKLIDFLIVPEEFALGFSGKDNLKKAIEFFLKQGPEAVVITQGKRGSLTGTKKKSFF